MSEKGLVVEFTLPSRKKAAENPAVPASDPVPRIARLLALAHKWEGMVRRGEVSGYAEIAGRMGLSRARVTQVCRLALLSPSLQARLLDADEPSSAQRLRRASTVPSWQDQERLADGGS